MNYKEYKIIWYKMKNGKIINSRDIANAFFIISGKYRWESEGKYIRFLNSLYGKSIDCIWNNPTVKEILNLGFKIDAIRLYREQNNSTLAEAKEAVEAMIV